MFSTFLSLVFAIEYPTYFARDRRVLDAAQGFSSSCLQLAGARAPVGSAGACYGRRVSYALVLRFVMPYGAAFVSSRM